MIWYKVHKREIGKENPEIKKINAIKETGSFVTYVYCDYNFKTIEIREAKNTDSYKYFKTEREAVEWLLDQNYNELKTHQEKVTKFGLAGMAMSIRLSEIDKENGNAETKEEV